ncbi:hypothetical protein OSTOST_09880, partial [Ostertagia ostertagi]
MPKSLGTPSGTRRMHSLQRTAGRYFYQWAVQIGDQLTRFIEVKESKEKAVLKMEDSMEDFFDDDGHVLAAIVNDASGEKCPPALQLIAMLLLHEITSFLRETFRTIPRAKNNKGLNQMKDGSAPRMASVIVNERERRISLSTAEEDSPRGSKDTIEDAVNEKR